jgi:hypothetical protein
MKCIKCGSEEFTLHKDGIDQGGYCDVHYWQGRAHRAEAELESKGAASMSDTTAVALIGGPRHGAEYKTSESWLPSVKHFPAKIDNKTALEKILSAETTVSVSSHRYILQQFVVSGKDVKAYVWEYTTPNEAIQFLEKQS